MSKANGSKKGTAAATIATAKQQKQKQQKQQKQQPAVDLDAEPLVEPATVFKAEEKRLRERLQVKVRALREARGLTLKVAGEGSEIHWRHWQKLEAGESNATMSTLVRVAAVLRVDLVELFEEVEQVEDGGRGAE
jgi:ribosome-binding protein aMBF1 (putative translation factor)